MPGLSVRELGEYIREQRRSAQVSVRQLARLAGVSNPYLSQIERGLRKPSAEILQQIAKALRISAETLYVQAGILEEREDSGDVASAIHSDAGLTERQKQVLLEIYDSFRTENALRAPADATSASPDPGPASTAGTEHSSTGPGAPQPGAPQPGGPEAGGPQPGGAAPEGSSSTTGTSAPAEPS